uniref:Lipoprotein n=1 Tax=Streptomyces sp. NBC_00003 TaxID=2903608 RepID=A0AAU2VCW5_9ACTN
MASGLRHRSSSSIALLALLVLTGACSSPSPAPPVPPLTPSPAAPDHVSPSPSPAQGPVLVGPAPTDLHDADWAKTPIPGEFCDVPGLIRLDAEGKATAVSRTWGTVRIQRGIKVEYGDTDGDQRDEAAIYMGCDDNGATMSGQLVAAYVVFTHKGNSLAVIGAITPRQKSAEYSTALVRLEFAPGRITAHEKWYRQTDAHCCATGDATTVWTREGDRLTPGEPRVVS